MSLSPSSRKYRLTYVNLPGIGEPIRLSFFLAGIPFEDRRIDYSEVNTIRKTLPTGQLPLLEIFDESSPTLRFSQSTSILRFVGRLSNLYPVESPLVCLRCDMILEALGDIVHVLKPLWYKSILWRSPLTGKPLVDLNPDQVRECQTQLNEVVLPARFGMLEKLLMEENGNYFCGGEMTICDLAFFVMGCGILGGWYCDGVSPSVLENCPGLRGLVARMKTHEKIIEWNNLETNRPSRLIAIGGV